jgi:Protein of unknown function (DUF2934)
MTSNLRSTTGDEDGSPGTKIPSDTRAAPGQPAQSREQQRRPAPATAAAPAAAAPTANRPVAKPAAPVVSGLSTQPQRATRTLAGIDPSSSREALIATAAYYRAQKRGFQPGHEVEDWLAAEREIDGTGTDPI